MRLKNKVAIITGGASGLGASTAQIFAKEGAQVVIADILENEGKEIVSKISEDGGIAKFIELNVSNETAWHNAVRETISIFGKINILINNAGISGARSDTTDGEYWEQLISINAKGTFLGIKTVVPKMKESGGGSIVNVSSMSAFVGQNLVHLGYNAAKGATRSMTKAAAVQYAPDGIRVNSIHPGIMPAMRTSLSTKDPKVRNEMISAVPLGREGRVEEVAYANLFLASDESSYITGTEIPVDGGFIAK